MSKAIKTCEYLSVLSLGINSDSHLGLCEIKNEEDQSKLLIAINMNSTLKIIYICIT